MTDHSRHGAQQPDRFNPAHAARLDDPARFAYLPTAAIIERLELERHASLLDFGAGTGTYAVEIARARPDVRIFALDEQPEMLDLLRSKIAKTNLATIETVEPAQAEALRGRIDRVLAINVLHELGDAALADLGSLLGADGFALIIDWNADVERPLGPPSAHVYGVERARARIEATGLRVGATTLFPYHYALTCYPAGTLRTT